MLLSLDERRTFLCSQGSEEAWSFGLPAGSMREMAGEMDDCKEVVFGGL